METIKCPACGTSNSAKRQICHICGQLLLQPVDQADGANIELLNDDLKAATEAALKEVNRASRGAGAEAKAGAREERGGSAAPPLARPRTQRDRNVLIAAVVVTVLALAFVVFYLVNTNAPRSGDDGDQNRPRRVVTPPATAALPGTPGTPRVQQPGQPIAPAPSTSSPSAPQGPAPQPAQSGGLEQVAADGVRSALPALLSRINGDLGTALSAANVTFAGMVSQRGDDTTVVTVTMQGSSFSGTASVLLQKLAGRWQAMYSKDWSLVFATPVTVQDLDGSQRAVSGARISSGGYEPLSTISSQEIIY